MNRIKQLRVNAGMKQSELGKLLNVKDAAISKYETGKIPLTADTLVALSEIFGVSIDYILGEDDDPRKEEMSGRHFFFFFNDRLKAVFKQRLGDSIEEKNLSLQEFSQASEIDIDTCKEYIEGEREPSLEHLIDISHALEVTTDYLLGQTPKITYYENKILAPFVKLNNDNKDIVIGKAKDLLREQEAREDDGSVAAEPPLKEAK